MNTEEYNDFFLAMQEAGQQFRKFQDLPWDTKTNMERITCINNYRDIVDQMTQLFPKDEFLKEHIKNVTTLMKEVEEDIIKMEDIKPWQPS